MKSVRWVLLGGGVLAMAVVAARIPRVGSVGRSGALVPTGQTVQPVGKVLSFTGRPVDMALSPDGKTLYLKDNRGLVCVRTEDWKLRQELKFPAGGGSMHGIAVSSDGTRVYLTSAQNVLFEANIAPDGTAAWGRQIALPGPGGQGDSHACGLALSRDGQRAYVCLSRNNRLGIVDLTAGRLLSEIPVGIAPWDVVLSPDGRTAYVSDWGGRLAKPGEATADSAGTPTPVDARGVASTGYVSWVDLASGREMAQVETGLHPSDLVLNGAGTRLYVANANSDTVSVLDTAGQRVIETLSVHPSESLPFGSAPNALALSPDEKTLYVANGGNNAVALLRLEAGPEHGKIGGLLPTGWYPGSLLLEGKRLFVASVKGLGSRTADPNGKGWNVYQYQGTVQQVELPDEATQRRYTAQALRDSNLAALTATNRTPSPLPTAPGEPSVFRHVVYILKENRTYDQVFGDLKQGEGDPKLCLFGRNITPNHHALAEQFALLDNYYCNGVLSADGHSWATEGNVTDHLEKAFGGFTRSYTFGDDPLTYSSSGFIWDGILKRGLTFRNYGEMDYATPQPASASYAEIYRDFVEKTGKITFTQNIGVANLRKYSCPTYPGWNMHIPDVVRADAFLKEFREFEKQGNFPHFVFLYLPSDHTEGTTPGAPTPRSYLADNDLALGRIVEALSQSRFWPQTCIFVNEDDPQDGFDHVDGHRSLCLVISPYTRRGAVIRQFYNQTSVLHTIARIFGISPMNQMDAMAPLMHECFTSKPDLRPYTCLPNQVPLAELNPSKTALQGKARYWAEQSQRQNFAQIDRAEEDTLNRILWHAMKGVDAPYPAQLAGAHGRGLQARGLRLLPHPTDAD